MALAPAVSRPWVPACGSLEPPRRDGENAQKTGKNGGKMGEIRPKTCEGRELTKNQLVPRLCVAVQPDSRKQRCTPGASGLDGYRRFKTTTLEEATTSSTGLREVHDMCRTCGYEDIYTETIDRIREESSSSSSSSSWSSSSSSSYSDNSSSSWSSSSSDSSWSDSSSGYSGGSSSGSGSSSTW